MVGSAQRLGVPFGFGGPHAGFMSVRAGLERCMPGRLVGVSVDADGAPAYRLALQTREQHIRREKATSNICTAQVLLAVMSSMYAVYHGPDGLRAIAERTAERAATLAAGIARAGGSLHGDDFFDTVRWSVPASADAMVAAALAEGITIRYVDEDTVSASVDETTTKAHVEALWRAYAAVNPRAADLRYDDVVAASGIPDALRRTSPFLTHPVFNTHRSETSMLRYIRRLGDRDVALDRAMIPLGSCTMKLNATTEMEAITWDEFAGLHPFAPLEQAAGYLELIRSLEAWLVEVTGYDAVSLQPNAGSQGEFAGLLAISAFHRANGDVDRDVCLIPSSAHGTNAASAVMAGLRVVVVACDDDGNVDVDDLRARIAEHGERLAALMVTYPSTHGVFETAIAEICALVHDAGGQVYVDGANLNALVGLAKPGQVRRRRVAPEPAQDVLHPAWRWWPGRRPGCGARAPGALPAVASAAARGGSGGPRARRRWSGAGERCPLGECRHPADPVGLHPDDGTGWPAAGDPGGHPQRQLHRRSTARPLPGALLGGAGPGRP